MPLLPGLLSGPSVDDLARFEGRGRRLARGVKLEAVEQQAVVVGQVVDREGQLKMAWVLGLELDCLAVPVPQQNRAAGALDVDMDLRGDDTVDGVGDLDVGIADFGGNEECACGWDGEKARHQREGLQQHGVAYKRGISAVRRLCLLVLVVTVGVNMANLYSPNEPNNITLLAEHWLNKSSTLDRYQ